MHRVGVVLGVLILLVCVVGWLLIDRKSPKPPPDRATGGGVAPGQVADQTAPFGEPQSVEAGDAASAGHGEPGRSAVLPSIVSPVRFSMVTDSGVDFRHGSGITEDRFYPCANGSGLGTLDLDRDGLYDLYFLTGNDFRPRAGQAPRTNRCYRNLGDWRFTDVSVPAGLGLASYSAGVAVGDIDGDGFSDVYVTCAGENQLFRNQGDGTFRRAVDSGTNHPGFAASCVFADVNHDRLPDLYVCNYGEWSVETNKYCDDGQGRNLRVFCSPSDIDPAPDVLFLNNGDGSFRDASEQLGDVSLRGQGVIALDMNDDDFVDLYVGNDGNANVLYTSGPDGRLVDATAVTGVAYDRLGQRQAGMGLAAADVNRDGSVDLMVTNFEGEHNTLYMAQGNRLFEDLSHTRGLVEGAMPWVGWGVSMRDLNTGDGHFAIVESGAGEYFEERHPARGLVVTDLDNDGDFDVIVGHQDSPPALLRNELAHGPPRSIEVRLIGRRVDRDAVGSKVRVRGATPPLVYYVHGGGSYLSADDHRVLVASTSPADLEIVWPGGRRSEVRQLQPGRRYVVVEPLRGRMAEAYQLNP